MKIFITGSTGFVGRHVVKRLSNSDNELHCLVRKNSDYAFIKKLGHTFHFGGLQDKRSIVNGMRGCDCVIHMAGRYSFWEPDKGVYKKINVEGTRNVLESAVQCKVAKFIHVSTGAVFGKPENGPITEESSIGNRLFSAYARSKLEGERLAWEYQKNRNLPVVFVYPGAVIGEGDDKPSGIYVKSLVRKKIPAIVCGDSVLTWVDVKDVAEGIFKILNSEVESGTKYILAGHQLSMNHFNQLVGEIAGVSLPKLKLPDSISLISAFFLTFLAKIISRPPLFGMSVDQVKNMKEGLQMVGNKAEKELGLKYTPIKKTLEEMIASFRRPL